MTEQVTSNPARVAPRLQGIQEFPSSSDNSSFEVSSLTSLTNAQTSQKGWIHSFFSRISACLGWLWNTLKMLMPGKSSPKDKGDDRVQPIVFPIEQSSSTIDWGSEKPRGVAVETMRCIQQGFYLYREERVALQSPEILIHTSQAFDLDPIHRPHVSRTVLAKFRETSVIVANQDCLDAAQAEVDIGAKVAVLLFSSPQNAGGGFFDGSGNGQEEQICFRSEIAGFMRYHELEQLRKLGTEDEPHLLFPLFLKEESKDVPDRNRMIHTPDVLVFRKSKVERYAFLEKPFKVGILTGAALHRPKLKNGNDYAADSDRQIVKTMIYDQLRIAYDLKYDTIILGAFGCGEFRNPSEAVAKLYREVIYTYFQGAFNKIIFAILGDDNYRIFEKEFPQ